MHNLYKKKVKMFLDITWMLPNIFILLLIVWNKGLHYLKRAHMTELGPSESEIPKNQWKGLAIYKEILP